MRLAAYQPDIPQNLGALIRLSACFAAPLDLIEPCGFPLTDRALKRAALDYSPSGLVRHESWTAFQAAARGRIVLLTTRGDSALTAFRFEPGDTLLLGRESAGVPAAAAQACAARIAVPLAPGARSLNVVVAAAIAVHEALRQTGGLPAFAARP